MTFPKPVPSFSWELVNSYRVLSGPSGFCPSRQDHHIALATSLLMTRVGRPMDANWYLLMARTYLSPKLMEVTCASSQPQTALIFRLGSDFLRMESGCASLS